MNSTTTDGNTGVFPPSRYLRSADHHWLEIFDDLDGHSYGLIVLQWAPGAQRWYLPGNVGTGMYRDVPSSWKYVGVCPLPGNTPPVTTDVLALTASEQSGLLKNPEGLRVLMMMEDVRYSEASSIFGTEDTGPWPTKRWTQFYERGRTIMSDDLGCWSDELRTTFGFPVAG